MALTRREKWKAGFVRIPSWFFRWRVGFLFGRRIIGIEHEGRTSGKTYVTAVEALYRDKETNEYFVVPARGRRSDWFKNIDKYPAAAIYVGSRRRRVRQRIVPVAEAVGIMKEYEREHPRAARAMLELAGVEGEPTGVTWRQTMEQLPMVAFQLR